MQMRSESQHLVDYYRTCLKRVTWRMQYQIRRDRTREMYIETHYVSDPSQFDLNVISNMYIRDLLRAMESEKARLVLEKLIVEGLTEKEVATELNISQQAVNKWKKKGLDSVRRMIQAS